MVYVALLRGINVGGKHTVAMARLKSTFEALGLENVSTFINSGNVIFTTSETDEAKLCTRIEKAIEKDFGFAVPTLLRNLTQMHAFMKQLPKNWHNDDRHKCDVMFLWPGYDKPGVVDLIKIKPEIEELKYIPGALVWRIGRADVRRGSTATIIGSDLYKQMTIRNANSVRKIYALMQALA